MRDNIDEGNRGDIVGNVVKMESNSNKIGPVRIQKKPRQLSKMPSFMRASSIENCENSSDDGSNEMIRMPPVTASERFVFSSKAPFKILELLELSANSGNMDATLINEACLYIKLNGRDLDCNEKNFEQMNHYFNMIRNIARQENIDSLSRTRLLEIIELRARNWTVEDDSYFDRKKASLVDSSIKNSPSLNEITQSQSSSALNSAEFIKQSGKISKPCKVAGKNFLKDEFVIRNSDSGKVNPGAKERLLQITGADDESISKAKFLIEDTIKRNASPVPPPTTEPSSFRASQFKGLQTSASASNLPPSLTTSTVNQQMNTNNSNRQENLISRSASSGEAFNLFRQSSLSPPVEESLSSSPPTSLVSTTLRRPLSSPNGPYLLAVQLSGGEQIVVTSSSCSIAEEARSVLEAHFSRKKPTSSLQINKKTTFDQSETSGSDQSLNNNKKNSGLSDNYNKSSYPMMRQASANALIDSNQQSNQTSANYVQRSASHGSCLYNSNNTNENRLVRNESNDSSSFRYDRDFLMRCSQSEISTSIPENFDQVIKTVPEIVRRDCNLFGNRNIKMEQPKSNVQNFDDIFSRFQDLRFK